MTQDQQIQEIPEGIDFTPAIQSIEYRTNEDGTTDTIVNIDADKLQGLLNAQQPT